ncbi:hypothetical protein CO101_01725 [Candidatus Berkelbacteria bacterium CG_4_9_14_3_um_filter_39_23]|uniref:Antitoxin n=2 Tax=Candidatus Berkelbacteria TaxID=1618330 RepID=A0A2M7CIV7_9BACT|nr:type II toxin-antitoxin system Phd/YefM family antitoxin [Candidatus Berkelbacteria bacterium]OIP04787.1 MAG: hypothetical protein AUK14_02530 [Candidatus Berkelbacteria bacterium CG2_30_39_44]PIR27999.1 MAG: hypothetical protein COV39_01385 [Candidatus Berkelbacteria bacterium CG11_big_fil_rev_8_21_14_0_20_40_23]PIV25573.1 MAG: hypothetical protein COS38_00835 [Candidatus Berkelbacteria bacterium CG03_land_8_20_14_0_80_40_36]PIX30455.1 MAG: hypothetical protein COZ62_02525 [Candidatus Berke
MTNKSIEVKEKIISTQKAQANISQIISEVASGGVFYKVLRYSEPKVAIINLDDLEHGKSFICQFCLKHKK